MENALRFVAIWSALNMTAVWKAGCIRLFSFVQVESVAHVTTMFPEFGACCVVHALQLVQLLYKSDK